MFSNKLKLASMLLVIVFVASGCSTASLKQENAALKQQIEQDEQTRQDYADKLQNATKMSTQERIRMQKEMASMRHDMNNMLHEKNVIVKKLNDLTVIEMDHSVLFSIGNADLSADGKAIVKDIATAFNQYPGYHMRIEGHTDNVPVGSALKQHYFSNWELSAARAASVVRYMIHALNVPDKNLSIAGYADNRPMTSNDTVEGRAQNRRIRAVVFKSNN